MKLHSDAYGFYKKSEGEWTEVIPSEWQEKRVKDLFRLVTQAASANNDHELLSLFAGIGVKPRKDMKARGNKASSTDGYWLVKKNDIVVNKLLAWMGSVGISEYEGVTSPAYDVLRQVKLDIDPRYYSYLFRTEIAKKIFRKNSRGIMDMRLRLYFDKLGAITVPLPSEKEQRLISDYIDIKTAQIDKKINLLRKKVGIYNKLKLSIINEAVTRGLDKLTVMKDSDDTRIGKIRRNWEIKRFKDIATLTTGNSLNHDLKEKYSIKITLSTPYVATKDIDQPTCSVDINNGIYIPNSEVKYKKAPSYSTLLCVEGASAGKKMTFVKQRVCYVNKLLCFSNNAKVDPLFLHYYIRSTPFSSTFNATLSGLRDGYWGVTGPEISRFMLPIPSLDEQREIATYLDTKTIEIDNIVANVSDQIDKYIKLRNALIHDAVTGEVKIISEDQAA